MIYNLSKNLSFCTQMEHNGRSSKNHFLVINSFLSLLIYSYYLFSIYNPLWLEKNDEKNKRRVTENEKRWDEWEEKEFGGKRKDRNSHIFDPILCISKFTQLPELAKIS